MPFKTKKHKKGAKSRRVSISEQGLASYKSVISFEKSPKNELGSQAINISRYSVDNYKYLGKEIRTIIAISLGIIGLQIILRLSNIT